MTAPDMHGPIDYLIIEFPADAAGDASADAMLQLVDSGVIALLDLLAVRRNADGTAEEIALEAATAGPLAGYAKLAGARSGLLGGDDVAEVAAILEGEATALVILYENNWAGPFAVAARGEGGQLVASARLTAQEIMDALDAVESAG